MSEVKTAAVLTVHAPGKMSVTGRKAIAKWLRKQADTLAEYGGAYGDGRYRARYLFTPREKK